jgi:uncharacterized protein with NRDE domain
MPRLVGPRSLSFGFNIGNKQTVCCHHKKLHSFIKGLPTPPIYINSHRFIKIMCLLVCSWDPKASPSLIIAANRDEFLDRPSQTAHFWPKESGGGGNSNNNDSNNNNSKSHPAVYGPRDLKMGGTWLACSTTGRFATITNYYNTADIKFKQEDGIDTKTKNSTKPTTAAKRTTEPDSVRRRPSKSRGAIPVTFLESSLSAMEFAKLIERESPMEYAGFCAILFDGTSLVYCSSRGSTTSTVSGGQEKDYQFVGQELVPGIYGLSNHLLDTPWPRLVRSKQAVANLLATYSSTTSTPAATTTTTTTTTTTSDARSISHLLYHVPLAQQLLEIMKESVPLPPQVPFTATTKPEWEEYLRLAVFLDGDAFGTMTTSIVTYSSGAGFAMTEQNYKTRFPSSVASFTEQYIGIVTKHEGTKLIRDEQQQTSSSHQAYTSISTALSRFPRLVSKL